MVSTFSEFYLAWSNERCEVFLVIILAHSKPYAPSEICFFVVKNLDKFYFASYDIFNRSLGVFCVFVLMVQPFLGFIVLLLVRECIAFYGRLID